MDNIKSVTINEVFIRVFRMGNTGKYYLQVSLKGFERMEGEFNTFKEANKAYKKLVLSYL